MLMLLLGGSGLRAAVLMASMPGGTRDVRREALGAMLLIIEGRREPVGSRFELPSSGLDKIELRPPLMDTREPRREPTLEPIREPALDAEIELFLENPCVITSE